MKKFLLIFGILLVLLISALAVIPYFFKDDFVKAIKHDLNDQLDATADFSDLSLSLFSSFPDMTITLDDLLIVNRDPFAGDTLADIREISATLDLWSLFNGPLAIKHIGIVAPKLNLKTTADGKNNWEILLAAEPATQAPVDSGGVQVALSGYELQDGRIRYQDALSEQDLLLDGLQHSGSGDFTASEFIISTRTRIATIRMQQAGATVLNDVELQASIDVGIDQPQKRYTLQENQIRLNALVLNIDGWIQQQGEDLNLNLRFNAPAAGFKDLLSMIPLFYSKDFQSLQAGGTFSLDGSATGMLTEKTLPVIKTAIMVRDGRFKYPDLPTPVSNVQFDLKIDNPGKAADATVISVDNLHLEIQNEPLDARLLVKNPVSDPYLETSLVGGLNLAEIKNIFPLEPGVELSGRVDSDFQLRGNLSAIEKNQVDKFSTGGTLNFKSVNYSAPDLAEPIAIKSANLKFSPQRATLNNFSAVFGKSDLQANGVLENIFGYVFHDQTIKGTLALQSRLLDLNPWLAGESETIAPVELPKLVEFALSTDFQRVLADKMEMKGVSSTVMLRDQKLNLMGLSASMLGGTLSTSGTYSFIPPASPQMFFDIDIASFNIPQTFRTFITVQKFAPIAEKMDGAFSGRLNLTTDLDGQFFPVWQSLASNGNLQVPKVKLTDTRIFNQLADKLKISSLHNPALNNLAPAYEIKNGRFFLEPLAFAIDNMQIEASGSAGIDQSIDYLMRLKIPAALLQQQANTVINQFLKRDINAFTGETIIVDVKVGGTHKDPRLTISGADVLKQAADPLKDAAKAEADRKKAEVASAAAAELEKKKLELEKQKKEAEEKLKNKLKGLLKK